MQQVAHASSPSFCPQSSGFSHRDCLLQVFTAGPFAMEFSAKMYGATWKFNEQGLPFDLEARYSSAGILVSHECTGQPSSLCSAESWHVR